MEEWSFVNSDFPVLRGSSVDWLKWQVYTLSTSWNTKLHFLEFFIFSSFDFRIFCTSIFYSFSNRLPFTTIRFSYAIKYEMERFDFDILDFMNIFFFVNFLLFRSSIWGGKRGKLFFRQLRRKSGRKGDFCWMNEIIRKIKFVARWLENWFHVRMVFH